MSRQRGVVSPKDSVTTQAAAAGMLVFPLVPVKPTKREEEQHKRNDKKEATLEAWARKLDRQIMLKKKSDPAITTGSLFNLSAKTY
jgi:hypothetical protein